MSKSSTQTKTGANASKGKAVNARDTSSKKRVNPNTTECNHAGCIVAAQSKRDKQKHLEDIKSGRRKVIIKKSKALGIFGV